MFVDHAEVSGHGQTYGTKRGGRPTVRHRLSKLNFGVRHTRAVLLGGSRPHERPSCCRSAEKADEFASFHNSYASRGVASAADLSTPVFRKHQQFMGSKRGTVLIAE